MEHNIIVFLFFIALGANAVAFVRHWRMMRVLNCVLNSLIETQKQFNEVMAEEQRKRPG